MKTGGDLHGRPFEPVIEMMQQDSGEDAGGIDGDIPGGGLPGGQEILDGFDKESVSQQECASPLYR